MDHEKTGVLLMLVGLAMLAGSAFVPDLPKLLNARWFHSYPASRVSMAVIALGTTTLGAEIAFRVLGRDWRALVAVLFGTALAICAIIDMPDTPDPDPTRKPRKKSPRHARNRKR